MPKIIVDFDDKEGKIIGMVKAHFGFSSKEETVKKIVQECKKINNLDLSLFDFKD